MIVLFQIFLNPINIRNFVSINYYLLFGLGQTIKLTVYSGNDYFLSSRYTCIHSMNDHNTFFLYF